MTFCKPGLALPLTSQGREVTQEAHQALTVLAWQPSLRPLVPPLDECFTVFHGLRPAGVHQVVALVRGRVPLLPWPTGSALQVLLPQRWREAGSTGSVLRVHC